jgi:hypothetical protein
MARFERSVRPLFDLLALVEIIFHAGSSCGTPAAGMCFVPILGAPYLPSTFRARFR